MKIFLSFLFCFLSLGFFAQTENLTLHYETDQFILSTKQKQELNGFLSSLPPEGVSFQVKGHTDDVGNAAYNQNLSEKRSAEVTRFLLANGVDKINLSNLAYGESEPKADNTTVEGKALNRRVTLVASLPKQKQKEDNETIADFYDQVRKAPQEFCISNKRDTTIVGEEGTILHIKANSIQRKDGKPIKGCIRIILKEAYTLSDMLMENLTTTSGDALLETDGMIYLNAISDDAALELTQEAVVLMPTDSLREDVSLFEGERDPHTQLIDWQKNNLKPIFPINGIYLKGCLQNRVRNEMIPDEVTDCKFFFCKIRKFFRRKNNPRSNAPDSSKNLNELSYDDTTRVRVPCGQLDSLMELFNVTSREELIYALNKEEFDKYGVKTERAYKAAKLKEMFEKYGVSSKKELAEAIREERLEKIELDFKSGKLDAKNLNYYAYSTNRFGWKNIDAFSKLNESEKTDFKVAVRPTPKIDMRMVFHSYGILTPLLANGNDYSALGGGFPIDATAWIVAMKIEKGELYLAMKKVKIKKETYQLDFEKLSLKEMKEKLRVLNL